MLENNNEINVKNIPQLNLYLTLVEERTVESFLDAETLLAELNKTLNLIDKIDEFFAFL